MSGYWLLAQLLSSFAPHSNLFFPHTNLSYSRGDELGRRGGVFYVGQMLGTLTAGFIQSGASANLDGVRGMAGWRYDILL